MPDQSQYKTSPKIIFALGAVTAIAAVALIAVVFLAFKDTSQKDVIAGEKEEKNQKIQKEASDIVIEPVVKEDHINGSIDAPVKIIQYSDLLCPFCKKHHNTLVQLKEDYGDSVVWVFRHFPLPSLHPEAPKYAEATECVAELGGEQAFWSVVNKMELEDLTLEKVPEAVTELGLDKTKYQECMDQGKYASAVEDSYTKSLDAGAQGTPYNVIVGPNGEKTPIPGAYPIETFKEVIDSLLER